MVELVSRTLHHASCYDRPCGHMGSPLAAGWTGASPCHHGLSAAHWNLHPNGGPTRGHDSTYQTSELTEKIPGIVVMSCVLIRNLPFL